ncbi:hypothetical protein N752_21005 [Desulforamulus aquiferis]|nr:hypothetical protein N752_21005 [Desulforamulus aquiferis]
MLYKPMDIFNNEWHQHHRKIYENWHDIITNEDIILMPGDLSWATKPEEVSNDVDYLGKLPGTVLMVPGNHDYWWQGISKTRKLVPHNVRLIQNDHILIQDIAICGTRGWTCPNSFQFTEQDEKIYNRELIRLENSLSSIKGKHREIIAMMHFMPTNEQHDKSGFIDLFLKYGVDRVVYGHLHDRARNYRLPDELWGLKFHLVSADFVNFRPILIACH